MMHGMIARVGQKSNLSERQLAMHEAHLRRGRHIRRQRRMHHFAKFRSSVTAKLPQFHESSPCPPHPSIRELAKAPAGHDHRPALLCKLRYPSASSPAECAPPPAAPESCTACRACAIAAIVDEVEVVARVENLRNHVRAEQRVQRLIDGIVAQREMAQTSSVGRYSATSLAGWPCRSRKLTRCK